jgi:hypothetical protein
MYITVGTSKLTIEYSAYNYDLITQQEKLEGAIFRK